MFINALSPVHLFQEIDQAGKGLEQPMEGVPWHNWDWMGFRIFPNNFGILWTDERKLLIQHSLCPSAEQP